MSKKKIVFIISSLSPGGAERVVVTLANKFVNEFDVFIIVLYRTNTVYDINEKVTILYIKEGYLPSNSLSQAVTSNLKYISEIVRKGRIYNFDILISFTSTVNIISIISAKILGVPILISERNNPIVYVPNFFWRILRGTLYRYSDGLIVQSKSVSRFYIKKIDKEKIFIIPNPIDENILSKRTLYDKRSNIILTVGRIDSNKNQELLIRAFANLNIDHWQLVIVGDGDLRIYCQDLVQKLNIEKQVIFTGNVKDTWEYYNLAKIFVFTSKSEGFPNALLEAVSYGVPCISTNCDYGPSEIINNDKNGFLIKVDNQVELENKLMTLIENNNKCKEFSDEALKSINKFRIDVVYKQWKTIIEEVI